MVNLWTMDRASLFGCHLAGSRFFELNGVRLHGLEWGDPARPPLLFLHGGSAHCHWWDQVAPAFADRYRVVSLDQRGHGASQWSDPPSYRTQDFAADLLGVLDQLGWERIILVGHSMGGHNAMSFAAWHGERLEALVIMDSRPAISPERLARARRRGGRPLPGYESLESAMARFRLLPPETVADPRLLRHLAEAGIFRRGERWVYRFDPACDGSREPVDAWPLLPRITAPTLVVRGEWSPILRRETATEIVERIPRARLEEVPGTHHHLLLDRPDAVVSVLERFFASVAPR